MRLFRWSIVAALCVATPAFGFWQSRLQVSVGTVTGYQGPGDVFASAFAWYSCARGYTASYAASGTGSACDVVDTATGLVTCTYHIKTSGFVDPTECNGVGQSCATACKVKKAYDQSGNTHDASQATLANMPTLTFSSTPTGTLPAMTFNGTSQQLLTGNVTQAQPITMSAVLDRTTVQAGGVIGASSMALGSPAGANLAQVNAGSGLTAAAADNAWHSVQGLLNTATSAINIDGSETTGGVGTGTISAQPIILGRPLFIFFAGNVAEAGIWGSTSNSTNRNALSANQHGTSGYNF